jgi:hypothetical protein
LLGHGIFTQVRKLKLPKTFRERKAFATRVCDHLKAAKQIGLTIPPNVLLWADRINK